MYLSLLTFMCKFSIGNFEELFGHQLKCKFHLVHLRSCFIVFYNINDKIKINFSKGKKSNVIDF